MLEQLIVANKAVNAFVWGLPAVGAIVGVGLLLTISGFTTVYGGWVSVLTAVAICCFAFSTALGWGLYGSRCAEFVFGRRSVRPFLVAYALVSLLGATVDLGVVWDVSETFNGVMAVPNLIALLLLSGKLVETMKGRGTK